MFFAGWTVRISITILFGILSFCVADAHLRKRIDVIDLITRHVPPVSVEATFAYRQEFGEHDAQYQKRLSALQKSMLEAYQMSYIAWYKVRQANAQKPDKTKLSFQVESILENRAVGGANSSLLGNLFFRACSHRSWDPNHKYDVPPWILTWEKQPTLVRPSMFSIAKVLVRNPTMVKAMVAKESPIIKEGSPKLTELEGIPKESATFYFSGFSSSDLLGVYWNTNTSDTDICLGKPTVVIPHQSERSRVLHTTRGKKKSLVISSNGILVMCEAWNRIMKTQPVESFHDYLVNPVATKHNLADGIRPSFYYLRALLKMANPSLKEGTGSTIKEANTLIGNNNREAMEDINVLTWLILALARQANYWDVEGEAAAWPDIPPKAVPAGQTGGPNIQSNPHGGAVPADQIGVAF